MLPGLQQQLVASPGCTAVGVGQSYQCRSVVCWWSAWSIDVYQWSVSDSGSVSVYLIIGGV